MGNIVLVPSHIDNKFQKNQQLLHCRLYIDFLYKHLINTLTYSCELQPTWVLYLINDFFILLSNV